MPNQQFFPWYDPMRGVASHEHLMELQAQGNLAEQRAKQPQQTLSEGLMQTGQGIIEFIANSELNRQKQAIIDKRIATEKALHDQEQANKDREYQLQQDREKREGTYQQAQIANMGKAKPVGPAVLTHDGQGYIQQQNYSDNTSKTFKIQGTPQAVLDRQAQLKATQQARQATLAAMLENRAATAEQKQAAKDALKAHKLYNTVIGPAWDGIKYDTAKSTQLLLNYMKSPAYKTLSATTQQEFSDLKGAADVPIVVPGENQQVFDPSDYYTP